MSWLLQILGLPPIKVRAAAAGCKSLGEEWRTVGGSWEKLGVLMQCSFAGKDELLTHTVLGTGFSYDFDYDQ